MARARVFEAPPNFVLTQAGRLPKSDADITFEDWKFVLSQLSPRDRQELLEFARLKLKLQEQEAERLHLEPRTRPA